MGGDPGRLAKLVVEEYEKAVRRAVEGVRTAPSELDAIKSFNDLGQAGLKFGHDLPLAVAQDAKDKAEADRKAEENKPLNLDTAKPSKTPTAAQIAEIDDAVKKRQFQVALDKAASAYGIDMSNVKKLKYDPSLKDADGFTDKDGTIHIGPSVFKYPDAGAARTASTVIHEVTHANQIKHHGSPQDRPTSAKDRAGQEWAAYEYMAYRAEALSFEKIGLSHDAARFAIEHAQANLMWLSDENQGKIARGEYWGMTPFKP